MDFTVIYCVCWAIICLLFTFYYACRKNYFWHVMFSMGTAIIMIGGSITHAVKGNPGHVFWMLLISGLCFAIYGGMKHKDEILSGIYTLHVRYTLTAIILGAAMMTEYSDKIVTLFN